MASSKKRKLSGGGAAGTDSQDPRAYYAAAPARHDEPRAQGVESIAEPDAQAVLQRTCAARQNALMARQLQAGCAHSGHPCIDDVAPKEEDLRAALQCFRDAWARCVVTEEHARVLHQVSHVCDSQCLLFCHRGIYICIRNGNSHLCNEIACPFLETTHEARVCTLTSRAYPLEFENTFEQGVVSNDYKRNVRVARKTPRVRGDGLSILAPVRVSSTPTSAMTFSPSPTPSTPKLVQLTPLEMIDILAGNVGRFMPPLSMPRRRELAREIAAVLAKMESTVYYRTHADPVRRYTLDLHTLIVLHAMANGGERVPLAVGDPGIFVIASHDDVAAHMPALPKATSLIKRSQTQFTDGSAITHCCLVEWCRLSQPAMSC